MLDRTIGRFKILGKIGQGGMASVWKAEDSLTGRVVALKTLSDELAQDPKACRRFLREGRDASRLDHPGIVPVLACGDDRGTHYIVFTLVEGETLAQRISRSPLECGEAIRVVSAAASALAHAHERGVIHRDVTTRNIMIRGDGAVVLIDFGIALTAESTRLTSQDTTIGTVAYLSPEMTTGDRVDPRSDLYSLGVVLYEALTGTLPFVDRRPQAYLYAIAHEDPTPPRQWRPDLPVALERFLLRALSRDPDLRPPTAAEYARELEACGAAEPATPDAEPPVERAISPVGAELPHPAFLAVMPFEVQAASSESDSERHAFASGLAAALETALQGIPEVHVVVAPPFSAAPSGDFARLARQLGANLLLRGSVRRAGSEVRVSWSLVLPGRGLQVASGSVEGSSFDLFALEDRLAAAVRLALNAGESVIGAARSRGRDPAAREHFLQALGYLRRYDHLASIDGAIRLLEGLVQSEDPSVPLFTALARAYLYRHRLTLEPEWERRAEEMWERAAAIDPQGVDVLVARGDLRSHLGRWDLATEDYRLVLAECPDHPDALVGMAQALKEAGHLKEAELFAANAVAVQLGHYRPYNLLGLIRLDQGRYTEALEPLTRAVVLAPDSARGHYNLSNVYYYLNDLEHALAGYAKSIEIEPSASAFANQGTTLFWLGRHDEAIESYRRAVALRPADARIWGHLGSALRWIPGRENECRAPLEQALRLLDERISRHAAFDSDLALRAAWLANLDRHAEALESIEEALAMAPNGVHTLATAVMVHERAGRRDSACGFLKEVLRAGYRAGMLRREPALAALIRAPEIAAILAAAETGASAGNPLGGGEA